MDDQEEIKKAMAGDFSPLYKLYKHDESINWRDCPCKLCEGVRNAVK